MLEEEKFVSLWGHIEELRTTLLLTFLVIGCGFILAFCFYSPLIKFFTSSFYDKANSSLLKQPLHYERMTNVTAFPLVYQLPLQARVIHASKDVQEISPTHYQLATGSFLEYSYPKEEQTLILLGPLEGMGLVFKVCFWISLACTAPLWIGIWLRFLLPGLKAHEKQHILPFIISAFFSLFIGGAFANFITIPTTNHYLQAFNAEIGRNFWSLAYYIDYTLILILGHAIAFELCLILLYIVHFQYISASWLRQQRRYMYVSAFILGALLTPPDVLTQCILAIPLLGIYELAIWYGKSRTNFKKECNVRIFQRENSHIA